MTFTDTFRASQTLRPKGEVIEPHSINFHKAADEKRAKDLKYQNNKYANNPQFREEVKARASRNYYKNPERHNQYTKEWFKQNPDKKKAIGRKCYHKNKDKWRVQIFHKREIRNYIELHSGYVNIRRYLKRRGMSAPKNFTTSLTKGVWYWTFAHP